MNESVVGENPAIETTTTTIDSIGKEATFRGVQVAVVVHLSSCLFVADDSGRWTFVSLVGV